MSNLQLLKDSQAKIKDATKDIRAFLYQFLDKDSLVETDTYMSSATFFDGVEALGEGVLTGYATIDGKTVAVVAQNSNVLGGSLSKAHAAKIVKTIKAAIKKNIPLISVLDSTGARIAEGVDVLEGYADIIASATELKHYVPHIAVVKGNALGLNGVYAMSADFVLMGKDSVASLNPPKSAIASADKNEKATKLLGADSLSENSLEATLLYKDNKDLSAKINALLSYLDNPVMDFTDDPNRTAAALNKGFSNRSLVTALCDKNSYLELFENFEKGVITALTSVNNIAVGLIVTNADDKSSKLTKNSMKKIRRFVNLVAKYDLPLIFTVDADGIDTCLACEQKGILLSASKLIAAIADADVTKIAVITGKAVGIGYAALAAKGTGFMYTVAFPDAVVSPVSSEVAVAVLEDSAEYKGTKNPKELKQKLIDKYETESANPFVSLKQGYVDDIIEPALVRPYIAAILSSLVD